VDRIGVLRTVLLAVLVGPFGTAGAGSQPMSKDDVITRLSGAWRYIGTWVDGVPRDRGPSPTGMIVYTAGGNMSVQIAPDRPRTKAGAEATPDEAKAALTGYIAYFGTYTVDERAGTITHHRTASIQPGDASPLVRAYEFKGDRLVLRPPGSKQEIVWERIK
jgi:Lipocalin-like domain